MPPEPSALQLVVSFMGGGVVAAIGNWAHANRSARCQREIDRLSAQLAALYGPLFLLTSQNERLFALARQFDAQYESHFVERTWDTSVPAAAAGIRASADATLQLGNAYMRRVVENNAQVMKVLVSGWHLADADDISLLSQFQLDFTRFQTEVESSDFKDVPFVISQALGAISYMRPELITRVRYRVERLRSRIRELAVPWYARPDL